MPSGGSFSLTLILTPGMWKRKWKLEAEAVEASFFCGSGSAKILREKGYRLFDLKNNLAKFFFHFPMWIKR